MPMAQGGTHRRFAPLAPRALLRWDVVGPLVRALAPGRTLEIGVGQGAAGARIAALSATSYEAFETDPDSRRVARERIGPFGGIVHDRPIEEVDPEPADLVCAFEVLEHIEDDTSALRGWGRYIRPGGRLLLSVPSDPDRYGPMDRRAGHFRRYNEPGLRVTVEAAGLETERVIAYGAPLGYAMEAVRNRLDQRRLAPYNGDLPSPAELTAASGRTRQFKGGSLGAVAVTSATAPFRYLQRVWPGGVGLVLLARPRED